MLRVGTQGTLPLHGSNHHLDEEPIFPKPETTVDSNEDTEKLIHAISSPSPTIGSKILYKPSPQMSYQASPNDQRNAQRNMFFEENFSSLAVAARKRFEKGEISKDELEVEQAMAKFWMK